MTATQAPPGFDEAFAAFRAGEYERARELLRKCLAQSPGHVGSLVGLAVCEREFGRLDDAQTLLRRALTADDSNVQGHYMLAKVLVEGGRIDDAVDEFRRTLALEPSHVGAAQDLALYESAGPVTEQLMAAGMMQPGAQAAPSKGTIAETADGPEQTLDDLRAGALLFKGRRRLWSHRRLWLGLPTVGLGVLLLSWAQRIEDAAPGAKVVIVLGPAGAQRTTDDTVGTLARLAADLVRYLGWAAVAVGVLGIFSAFVNSAMSQYVVREKRIEITEGVFRRVRRIVWMFRIQDVRVVQNLPMLLSNTAKLTIHHEDTVVNPSTRVGWWLRPPPAITAAASTGKMIRMMEDIHRRAILERRAMKKAFI